LKGTDERCAKSLNFNDLLYNRILKVQFACNQRFRANRLYRYVLVSERKVIQNLRNYKNNHGKNLRYSP